MHLNQDEVNSTFAENHGKSLRVQRLNTGWLSRQIGLEPKPDHPKLLAEQIYPVIQSVTVRRLFTILSQ